MKRKEPLTETLKFIARMAVFALPFVITYFTDIGQPEYGALASAVLAIVDKYLHNSKSELNGLTPF
jgi:hypothetical protein